MSIMRNLFLFIFCALYASALEAQAPSVEALRAHAEEKGMPPKEYIFKLFEQSDIVVLGERDHRDTVQYNLILDILADPRFAGQIGHVYTEVGCRNRTDAVNRLLQGTYPTETAFRDSLYAYFRQTEVFYPMWEKYNRVKFLKGLYHINRTSPQKIILGLTDCRFAWEEVRTPEDYKGFWHAAGTNYRDSLMCAHFAEMYALQTPLNGKRKALVITNQPHAIRHSVYIEALNKDYHTQGWWMKQTFGEEKVKIVLLNWFDYAQFNGRNCPMTGEGHWDAAFELMDSCPFGLDLRDTPYGKTAFVGDLGGNTTATLNRRWQDVADGLIYDAPLYDHVAAWGIDGLITKEFEPEIERRAALFFKATRPDAEVPPLENFIDEYGVFHTYPAVFKSKEEVKRLIQEVLGKQQEN